jgi:thiamine kinase-like enzyme
MHGHFYNRIDRIRRHEFLIIHDAEFFWSRAELALRATSEVSADLGGRLAKVVGHYARAVDVMMSQPPTLLHGGYRPSNVLVQIRSDPGRVCTVDWEEAGLGPPLHDLAYLADGFQPPTLDRLLDAYREGAQGSGMPLPGRDEMVEIIDCFRLHMVMNLLGRSLISNWSEPGVIKLVTMAEQLGCAVL